MFRSFTYSFLLVFVFSCGKIGLYSNFRGERIASVASVSLYEDDIRAYFLSHPYISDSDSIMLRNAFIDSWIKNQALQYSANEYISGSSSLAVEEIEQRVNQYRDQLVLHEFENSFIESSLDTSVSVQAINEYYNSHLSSFKLSEPVIKCYIARIPVGVRQSSKLENLFFSKKLEDVNEFLEICNKNSYQTSDFTDNWVDLSEIIKYVPISVQVADKVFPNRPFYTIEDDTWRYMIKIVSYLRSGSQTPIEREFTNIKKILLHERSMLLRSALEDSIVNEAYSQGIISRL